MRHRLLFILAAMSLSPGTTNLGTQRLQAAELPEHALHQVTFVDTRRGWAVGDHGTVLHTENGGRVWHVQRTGVTCTLWDVHFVSPDQGIIVGGGSLPLTHESRGVVLRTSDGGRSWRAVPALDLPALRGVSMFDRERGIAFGQASTKYPSGIAKTMDGGRSWYDAMPGLPAVAGYPPWQAGAFDAGDHGLVAAEHKVVQFSPRVTPRILRLPENPRITQVVIHSEGANWALSAGSQLYRQARGQADWSLFELPVGDRKRERLSAIASVGNHVWLGTETGRSMYRSSDGGTNWQTTSTPETPPIHAIHFYDRRHGWAVGGRGCILATEDGGKSWQSQHQVVREPDAMVVADAADPEAVLVVAHLRQSGAWPLVLFDAEQHLPQDTAERFLGDDRRSRIRQAYLSAGAGDVEFLDRADGTSRGELLAERIRNWRPRVVVIAGNPQQAAGRGSSLLQDGQTAIAMAEQGENAHVPQRVYYRRSGEGSGIEIEPTRLTANSSRTLGELTMRARGLLLTGSWSEPKLQRYVATADRSNARGSNKDFLAGLPVYARPSRTAGGDAQSFRKRAMAHSLATALAADVNDDLRWHDEIRQLVGLVDPTVSVATLMRLANHYEQQGRISMAAATYAHLVEHFSNDEFAPAAALWLIHCHASEEIAHTRQGSKPSERHPAVLRQQGAESVPQLGSEGSVGVIPDVDPDFEAWTRWIAATYPESAAEPLVRIPIASWHRRHGQAAQAEETYVAVHQRRSSDTWTRIAAAERWLADPNGRRSPLPEVQCVRVDTRPHLDGVLEEAVWSTMTPVVWSSPGDSGPQAGSGANSVVRATEVRLGHDGEYCYVGIRAERAGPAAADSNGVRGRDDDLSRYDRVAIRLDCDRDYVTSYEHVVDLRGHTRDACWCNSAWNPKWYVASGGDATMWTIEAAIPLAAWTGSPPEPGDAWAISLRRLCGFAWVSSWHGPDSREPGPEHLGLLRWE